MGQVSKSISHHPHDNLLSPFLLLSLFLSSVRCRQVTRIDTYCNVPIVMHFFPRDKWNVDRFTEDCNSLGFRMINKAKGITCATAAINVNHATNPD